MLLFCKLQLDVASAPSSSTPLSTHQSSAESPSVRSSSHSASSSTQLTSQPLATNSSLLPSSFTSPVSSSDLPPSSPPSSRIPPQAPGLRVASWNARSLTDKHALLGNRFWRETWICLPLLKAGNIARKILQFYVQLQQDIHLATILTNCYLTLVRREEEV